jgi:phage terminase large subunit GpA-like protein
MNKAQRRAHVEPPCPECGSRVIPTWKDERSPADAQPDWHISARQCSSENCALNEARNW